MKVLSMQRLLLFIDVQVPARFGRPAVRILLVDNTGILCATSSAPLGRKLNRSSTKGSGLSFDLNASQIR